MLIQCTKKLLEQLNRKPDLSSVDENPLFSWHANLILLNRRKTVVLMNDRNRYAVVLHGLKAKDFSQFDQIVIQAIREAFLEEGIKDEIVEKYISEAKQVTVTKTKDRTSVARLNKACEAVTFYTDQLTTDTIFNSKSSKQVSRYLVGDGKKDYIYPNEELYKDLELFAGEPIFSGKAVQLKITLRLENHKVWRRIVVPLNRTFEELHDIIQTAFGWKNYHLHEFYIYKQSVTKIGNSLHPEGYKPILNLVCDEESFAYPSEMDKKFDADVLLADYIPTHQKIQYVYDFGDHWQHIIDLEEVIDDYPTNHPVCLDGEGSTPPEDVGGEGGFESFLEIISDPNNEEYQDMVRWGKMQGYQEFKLVWVNASLKDR